MHEPSITVTTLLILLTCVWSFLGFRNPSIEEKYIFHPGSILGGKEYYRLVTSGFLHADWNHLILNMLSLYFFAPHVEFVLGTTKFLLIYFGSVVGGNLLSLYVHRHHHYFAYGASGGVCGMIFAYILLFPGSSVRMFYLPIGIPAWLYSIGFMLYSFYGMKENNKGGIGHDAHLGGSIVGLLITAAIDPESVRDNLRIFLIVLISALLLLCYLWFNSLFLPLAAFLSRKSKTRFPSSNLPSHKKENLQVDAILDKIARTGVESLTEQEKSLLGEVSNKYRRRADSKKPDSGLAI
jgi:membrane associated rhomboid family serine protease